MLFYLLLLFTVVPLTEFWLLFQLGVQIGLVPTVALVLGTGALGAWLARQQGVATLWRIQTESRSGRLPADALFDGALILVAGAVLITPGVLTDAMGFALLIPPLRALVKKGLRHWFARNVRVETNVGGAYWSNASMPPDRGDVIDVEVIETRVSSE